MTPQEFAKKRAADKMFGYKIREKLFPGEDEYFKTHENVAGMAAEDGRIILNPYSKLSKQELGLVALNEALRLKMRDDDFDPQFQVTSDQVSYFKGTAYEKNPKAMRQTILARIYSGDPSAMATPQQKKALEEYLQ
jgi:hypothetical protein